MDGFVVMAYQESGILVTSNDGCEPALDSSSLGLSEPVLRNSAVRNVSAQLESGDEQGANVLAQTESKSADGMLIGSTSKTDVIFKTLLKNGHFFQRAVKRFKRPETVTDKYKHFVRIMKHQRCPFLVPIVKIVDEPSYYFQVISPYMSEGLERLLSHRMADCMKDKRAEVITIACQISEGLAFLHERNIVHGDINPRHILFDQHEVVRLADYGMYSHVNAESLISHHRGRHANAAEVDTRKCFRNDINSFAKIILQLMKPSLSEDELDSLTRAKTIKKAFCGSIWYAECENVIFSEISKVVLLCLNCECHSTTSHKVNEKLKAIMGRFKPALELTSLTGQQQKEKPVCLYCSVLPVHPELQLRSTLCPEICPYLRACISCLVKFGSHCHVENEVCAHRFVSEIGYVENKCPIHKCAIEPVIGGERSFAMILCDTSEKDGIFETDVMSIMQVASHPKIMRVPFKNVHRISIPHVKDSRFRQTCECVVETLKEILSKKPVFFLFYYSGHQLVKPGKKSKPRGGYEQLVEILHESVTEIAQICPRVLIVLDCCYASAVADLLKIELRDDSHVEWHAQWCSCRLEQMSNAGHDGSAFTQYVVSALRDGTERPCPDQTESCKICLKFRSSCRENGYICLNESAEFVRQHMHSRQRKTREDPSDVQDPILKMTVVCKPIISFFCKEKVLYTFACESTTECTSAIRKFPTDDLTAENIWNITVDRGMHLKNAYHVKYFERYSMQPLGDSYFGERMPTCDSMRILEAVSKDNKCLLVKIDDTPVENKDDDE